MTVSSIELVIEKNPHIKKAISMVNALLIEQISNDTWKVSCADLDEDDGYSIIKKYNGQQRLDGQVRDYPFVLQKWDNRGIHPSQDEDALFIGTVEAGVRITASRIFDQTSMNMKLFI